MHQRMPKEALTAELARQWLRYEPDTGIFYWAASSGSNAVVGRIAGNKKKDGYVVIRLFRHGYMAHRLAWLMTHGYWPPEQIDHANCQKDDNRIANLRLAGFRENGRNQPMRHDNTSGVKGVHWDSGRRKWVAKCMADGRRHFLGHFDDKDAAAGAVMESRKRMHGEFANHGLVA